MAVVIPDTSPGDLLRRVRGSITDASLTYPERMRLEIADAAGGVWRLITWYAEYSPTDPDKLDGKTVVDIELDPRTDVLTVGFSDETCFTVTPVPDEEDDAIENWELFTPEDVVLAYGPRGRWQLCRATDPC
jgi:hypothetical protein